LDDSRSHDVGTVSTHPRRGSGRRENVKHWSETRQVLDRLDAVVRAGGRAALATVIGVRGSAYRRPGSKLLIADDGTTTGNVSGGCLEQDVREVGLHVLATGCMQQRTYRSRADDDVFGLGLGCEGDVDIVIEPAWAPRPAERTLLDGRAPFAICTRLDDGARVIVTDETVVGAWCDWRSMVVSLDDRAVFIECLRPPPRLVICGSGADTLPLRRLAAEVGFDVLCGAGRLDDCACSVVMTHNFSRDCAHVRELLDAKVPYIGVLGPRRCTERLLDALAADPLSARGCTAQSAWTSAPTAPSKLPSQ
jgi:xanthine dehydrogenase accessory factor